jgi:hypothetical protein
MSPRHVLRAVRAEGKLVLAGAYDPPDGALLVFRCDGRVRRWNVVVGGCSAARARRSEPAEHAALQPELGHPAVGRHDAHVQGGAHGERDVREGADDELRLE